MFGVNSNNNCSVPDDGPWPKYRVVLLIKMCSERDRSCLLFVVEVEV